jgi:hypothetical protein
VKRCDLSQLDTPAVQEWRGSDKDGIGSVVAHGLESGIDLNAGVGIVYLNLHPHGSRGRIHVLQLNFGETCVRRIDKQTDPANPGQQITK